uniref:Uncharacterized protein n=1 Tax=Plectus sambesii TaxID=2011161 RepID=A0A914WME7_9BILA
MSDKSDAKTKSSSRVELTPAVSTVDQPTYYASGSFEILENVADEDVSSLKIGELQSSDLVDDNARVVTFTGEERIHDVDIDVLATYSRSTDTSSYKSTDSIPSYALRQLQSEALRIEPPFERPLISHHLLVDSDGSFPSFDSLPSPDLHCSQPISLGIGRPRRVCLATDAVAEDSQLVSDVITDVIEQYLSSRPLNTALSIHLRPVTPLAAPSLQVHLHHVPLTSSFSIAAENESSKSSDLTTDQAQLVGRQACKSAESICNSMCDSKLADDASTANVIVGDMTASTQATISEEVCCIALTRNDYYAPPASSSSVKELLGVERGALEHCAGDDLFSDHHRLLKADKSTDENDSVQASTAQTVFLTRPQTVEIFKVKMKQRTMDCQLGLDCLPTVAVRNFRAVGHRGVSQPCSELIQPTQTVFFEEDHLVEAVIPRLNISSDTVMSITTELDEGDDDRPTVDVSISLEVVVSFDYE